MNITIKYCTQRNYLPRAAGLAEAIAEEFGANRNIRVKL